MINLALNKHDRRIYEIAEKFKELNYEVFADHIQGFKKPFERNGYIPDLVLKSPNVYERMQVIEIETEESKNSLHSIEQCIALRLWCNENNAEFMLVIA